MNDIDRLRAARPHLPAKDHEFADSLIAAAQAPRGLRDNQRYWVGRLADRAATPASAAPSAKVESVAPLYALLERAASHLKRPGFRVLVNGHEPARLRIAAKGPNAGSLELVGDWLDTQWGPRLEKFGVLTRDGAWTPGPAARGDAPAYLEAVRRFTADPEGAARRYGRLTGSCCFCARTLTDARSITVGYGPVCAEHYGLPWGECVAA